MADTTKAVDTTKIRTLFPELLHSSEEELAPLAEYYESILHLSLNKLNLEFNNKDMHHAALVMSTIFNSAETKIKIFARNFKGDICDKEIYIDSLKKAILNNKNISIVFEETPNANSRCLNMILNQRKERPDQITIKVLNKDFKIKFKKNIGDDLNNFTVADKKMFRCETDMDLYKAFCNFDDEKIATILDNNFTVLLRESTTYSQG